ncbi:MAG TPA: hypothetical protein DDW28_09060 [Prevotella sp.]|nr:hypothetical protein [Candidatus Segatella violae]
MVRVKTIIFLIVYCFSFQFSFAGNQGKGLMFRISGNDLKTPSFFLGSFHFMDGKSIHQLTSYDSVFARVSQVCFETDMNVTPKTIGSTQRNGDRASLSKLPVENNSLGRFLPKDSTYIIMLGVKKEHDMDSVFMSLGLPKAVIGLRPSYLRMVLDIVYNYKVFSSTNFADTVVRRFVPMDYSIYHEAVRSNKTILKLEPIAVQDSILKKMMEKTVNSVGTPIPLYDEMQEVYGYCMSLSQRVQQVSSARKLYLAGESGELISMLSQKNMEGANVDMKVAKRNASWIKEIPGMMEKGSTLFVVGLAHLFPYKDSIGILAELKHLGYHIEVVD